MDELATRHVRCPYCGESIELLADLSAGAQAYVEDCQVCCRPIEVRLWHDGGHWRLEAQRDDE